MSDSNVSRPSVTELYRRFADTAGIADADQLVQQMQASPARAGLLRFSRDLAPESAALSAKLVAALNESNENAAHRRRRAPRRAIAGSRRWRGIAALAASLIAAVALWNTQRMVVTHAVPAAQISSAAIAALASDRIFAGFNEGAFAARTIPARDEIFRAQFLPDEIFNSKTHDG